MRTPRRTTARTTPQVTPTSYFVEYRVRCSRPECRFSGLRPIPSDALWATVFTPHTYTNGRWTRILREALYRVALDVGHDCGGVTVERIVEIRGRSFMVSGGKYPIVGFILGPVLTGRSHQR